MINLSYVLRASWRITWHRKRLWLLGFAASLSLVGFRTGLAGPTGWLRAAAELSPNAEAWFQRFLDSPYLPVLAIVIGVLVLAGAFGLTVVNALGQGALVDQVRSAEEYGLVELRAGWEEGKRRLWRVFLLRLILGLPPLLAAGSAALVGALSAVSPWMGPAWYVEGMRSYMWVVGLVSLCLAPVVVVLLLASIPLSVLLRFAVRACVLEGYGFRESIRRAWLTGRQHWVASVLLWLVQSAGVGGVYAVLGLPLLAGAAVVSLGAVSVGLVSTAWSIALTALVSLVGWLVGGLLGGVIETFVSAMWTLAYREMHGLGQTGEAMVRAQEPGVET
jgi:hypothetical protein